MFNDELPIGQIVDFIRNYNVTQIPDVSLMNSASSSSTLDVIKNKLGLSKLDNLHLMKKDINNIINVELDF